MPRSRTTHRPIRSGVSRRAARRATEDRGAPPFFGVRQPNPYTWEGQMEQRYLLLSGAKRLGGWRMWVVFAVLGVPAIVMALLLVVQAFDTLL